MKISYAFLIAIALTFSLSACGHKSRLKSPAQIEKEEAKKAAKLAKETAKKASEPEAVQEP